MAGIYIKLVRIANGEDPDQTASSEAVLSGSHCLSRPFCPATSVVEILAHFKYFRVCHRT